MEAKLKHLDFIQAAISRMAKNSFLLKGWSITLTGALLALSFKELNYLYLIVSISVLVFFWLIDGFYMSREWVFIKLYNHVRVLPTEKIDFSMDIKPFQGCFDWLRGMFSRVMFAFYGGLIIVHIIIALILIY